MLCQVWDGRIKHGGKIYSVGSDFLDYLKQARLTTCRMLYCRVVLLLLELISDLSSFMRNTEVRRKFSTGNQTPLLLDSPAQRLAHVALKQGKETAEEHFVHLYLRIFILSLFTFLCDLPEVSYFPRTAGRTSFIPLTPKKFASDYDFNSLNYDASCFVTFYSCI